MQPVWKEAEHDIDNNILQAYTVVYFRVCMKETNV